MSVVNFPVCRFLSHALVGPNSVAEGLHWYGGRGFKTKQDVIDCTSDKDWRRIVQWERRHEAWIASKQPDGGTNAQGGEHYHDMLKRIRDHVEGELVRSN